MTPPVPPADYGQALNALLLVVGAIGGACGAVISIVVCVVMLWKAGVKIGLPQIIDGLAESKSFEKLVDKRVEHKTGDQMCSYDSKIQSILHGVRVLSLNFSNLVTHLRAKGELNGFEIHQHRDQEVGEF
jgi:hypothetical protein